MIEELRIQGIGVIAEARIELGPGLTVVTGETGAGKTMVLNGLDLLRGARADSAVVRESQQPAEVSAFVSVDDASDRALLGTLNALDIPTEDGGLITRRVVSSGGRSRAFLADRPVPVSALADVWSHLVSVHGQSEQARLRETGWQRGVVDRFGGAELAKALAAYADSWSQWQDVKRELADLVAGVQERERTAALLRLGIAEIDEVAPEPGEDVALDAEAQVLEHAGSLRDAGEAARGALAGKGDDIDSSSAVARLVQAQEALTHVATFDDRLAGIASRLKALVVEAQDIEGELGDYLRGLDADPARQAWVEERRAKLAVLRKSYGASLEDVLRWRKDAAEQIAQADSSGERIEALRSRERELAQQLSLSAESLSRLRRSSAHDFTEVVAGELEALAMPQARIDVSIESTTDPQGLRSHGGDEVSMLLTAHPGAPARPLGKGASGGELSRLALAFEVALAGRDSVPTMVFDEVDAGVGGSVAVEVGRRLARLSRHVQVIVVTHLPQVAAFADRHLVVSKSQDGSVTAANVRRVDDGDRLAELVRMLSGLEGSETGAAHAKELLDVAQRESATADGSGAPSKRSRSTASSR